MSGKAMNRRACAVFVAVIELVGCSGDGHAVRPPNSVAPVASSVPDGSGLAPIGVIATATTSTSAAGCDAPTPIVHSEVQGISADASIYGLLFMKHQPPSRVGDEVKIVWRNDRNGRAVSGVHVADCTTRRADLRPRAHAGSTYTRPGDECGTGFVFDELGCWHIHLERSDVSGDVWFNVAAA